MNTIFRDDDDFMIVFLHYAFTILTISFHFSDKKKEAAHKKIRRFA